MVSGSPDWWMQGRLSVISTPAESVEWVGIYDDTPADPGDFKSMILRAPAGYIYEVITMNLSVTSVSGATSGTHAFQIEDEEAGIPVTRAVSTYNTGLSYIYSIWRVASSYVYPTDEVAQLLCIRGLRADSSTGIAVEYQNATNATQTQPRFAWFWLRKIKVTEI